METDPDKVAELARQRRDENWRFRSFLKATRIGSGRLNEAAESFARQAEEQIDCRQCGACCKDNCITVNEEEVACLAEHLELEIEVFKARYIGRDDDGCPAIDATPCPFLSDKICTVYEARPLACRGYPYIGGDIKSRTIGILERAETCPIIFEMLERLKDQFWKKALR